MIDENDPNSKCNFLEINGCIPIENEEDKKIENEASHRSTAKSNL
jgi:hypothetical protein